MNGSLDGIGVVVTRPAHQAGPLTAALEKAGAEVIGFPSLAIKSEPDSETTRALAAEAASADWLIFVSPNAVEHGLHRIKEAGGPSANTRVATVGQGTAEALRHAGVGDVLFPRKGATSEDLLVETPLGKAAHERVIIVRGRGGRQHLAETLRKQGAKVDFLEVYSRECPNTDPQQLHAAISQGRVHVVIITSGEVLGNFLTLIGEYGRRWLEQAGAVVIGDRVAALAKPHFRHVETTQTAAEHELIAASARAAAAVEEIQE
ncbi:uroporphyrinogen-III synthase [Halorhodospira halochloris]|uniref:Uroporphyrinogen-III synthase n=1 Tax=Halorhodospira halochloris TaxID=1052 RepID=A0A110B4Q2_HALHR|nr:uroporphyrinogen-III synthase [Halorhodospira halochloris]MBK1650977.1 hypothetical protein [Halorhodospira halochloris]MCG5529344.1 uroporphyrinogen-III synthase [Halorhodospira halochloris]BAU56513.1 uroporphyrinogen-III synthase [Halorhodospira halochloris]